MSVPKSRFALPVLIVSASVLILGVFLGSASAVSAQDDVAPADVIVGDNVVVIDGPLNVREEATTDSAVLAVLSQGETVEAIGGPEAGNDGYYWYHVTTSENVTGWVAADFIAEVTQQFSVGDSAVVSDGPLNVRSGAGTDYSVLGTLAQDEEVTIVSGPYSANGYTWYEVSGSIDGYVAADFISSSPNNPGAGGSLPLPLQSQVYVNTDSLHVRDKVGLDSNVLGSVSYGDIGVVTDSGIASDGYTWYGVRFDDVGLHGWVAGEFLSGGAQVGQNAIVADGPLNLRDAHSTSGNVIDVLSTGDVVSITAGPFSGSGYAWYEVQYDGVPGFVAAEYLSAEIAS